ncbi:MAG: acyl-CoA dehydrogenase family protein [Timaviella obliquedivisa GSE-PSE-MK23-08B]|jgi:alkylation response protein AidB-like acyl-CoA dehydrogenase|nr:acyl-CoA dehydrogenase family protein [Timaviella obliquedivisa GSE-PSE-MK23-08B]
MSIFWKKVSLNPQNIEQTVERVNASIRQPGFTAAFTVDVEGDARLVIVAEVERRYRQSQPEEQAETWGDRRQSNLDDHAPVHQPLDVEDIIAGIRYSVAEHHDLPVYAVLLLRAGMMPLMPDGRVDRGTCRESYLASTLEAIAESRLMISETSGKDDLVNCPKKEDANKKTEGHLEPNQNDGIAADRSIETLLQKLRSQRKQSQNRDISPLVMNLAQQGLLGMQIPLQYGGLGFDHFSTLRVLQQLGAIDISLALFISLHNALGVYPIMHYSSIATRRELLPLLAAGHELAAFALMEEGTDSFSPTIASKAIANGRGDWQLWGKKKWSSPNSSCIPGIFNIFVQQVDAQGNTQGIAGFVVRDSLRQERAGTLGNTLFLEGDIVSSEQRLSKVGAGMDIAQNVMQLHRLSIAAVCLGGMKRCAQMTLQATQHLTVSADQPFDHPVTLMGLSETTLAIAAVESLVSHLGLLLDQGYPVPMEAYLACKTSAPEFFWKSADSLVQFLGERSDVLEILQDARLLRMVEGSTETLNSLLGEQVIYDGDALHQFLCHELRAPDIAETLKTAAFQIHDRYTQFPGRFTPPAASQWADGAIGAIATWAILWAAVGRALNATPSPLLQQTFNWAQLQFEHRLFQALIPMASEVTLSTAEEMIEAVAHYADAIGEIGINQDLDTPTKLPTNHESEQG